GVRRVDEQGVPGGGQLDDVDVVVHLARGDLGHASRPHGPALAVETTAEAAGIALRQDDALGYFLSDVRHIRRLPTWGDLGGDRACRRSLVPSSPGTATVNRKSTRLNSSHVSSSYAVCCLKTKRP